MNELAKASPYVAFWIAVAVVLGLLVTSESQPEAPIPNFTCPDTHTPSYRELGNNRKFTCIEIE